MYRYPQTSKVTRIREQYQVGARCTLEIRRFPRWPSGSMLVHGHLYGMEINKSYILSDAYSHFIAT